MTGKAASGIRRNLGGGRGPRHTGLPAGWPGVGRGQAARW